MPSQFSAIGFDISSGEDLAALASRVAERADTIDAAEGQYLRWAPPSGEQLWLQVKRNGDAMGMNPHFEGRSVVRAAIEARVTRPNHSPLDGTFLAWANPPTDGTLGGDYPFAFDCPDAATITADLPAVVTLQVAAFAQQLTIYEDEAAFNAEQAAQGLSFGIGSFIPSGLISPNGEPVVPPEPHALFTGVITDGGARQNSLTGVPYAWALVETAGGTFDVVIDRSLVNGAIRPGSVLSGWFWLSARVRQPGRESGSRGGWLKSLIGRR